MPIPGSRRSGPLGNVDGVRQALAAVGASLLYLPPCSPDLNPIEQLFAKLKALLRKAAARTRDEVWWSSGRLLATVPRPNAPTTSTTVVMVPPEVRMLSRRS